MRKDELFCFVCVPFISEVGARYKEPDCDVNYPLVNRMACDRVKQAGFTPISPIHLWSYCFEDIYSRYNKERIIQSGLRLIKSCEYFYFCDCEYDEKTHKEMEIWRIKAQMLNKRFISIDRKFLKY